MCTIWLTPAFPTEQIENDILGEKTQLEEAKAGIVDLHKELAKLQSKVNLSEVRLRACAYRDVLLRNFHLTDGRVSFTPFFFHDSLGRACESRGKAARRDGYPQSV